MPLCPTARLTSCLPGAPAVQGQAIKKHAAFVWLDGQCDYKYLIHTAGFSYSGGACLRASTPVHSA